MVTPRPDGQPQTSRSEAVYQALTAALRRGAVRPGTRLVESDLAAAMTVSRTPVREALRRIESDGLVRSERNRGYVVLNAMDDAAQVFLIREALEGLAAELAAQHITVPELQQLDELQKRMEEIVRSGSKEIDELVELNGEFHRRVTEASRSPRLIQMVTRLHPEYVSFQVVRLYSDKQRSRSIRDHRELLGALWRRDPEVANRLVKDHLEHGKAVVLGLLERGGERQDG